MHLINTTFQKVGEHQDVNLEIPTKLSFLKEGV